MLNMNTFVAFQLGINLGKRQVKMADLKKLLEDSGFDNVRTLLASGNVVLDVKESNVQTITNKLDELMSEKFGFAIKNIVRTMDEIKNLINANPFRSIKITAQTRLYVTFLLEPNKTSLKIPYETPEKDFRILQVTDTEVISVKALSEKSGTIEAMQILAKVFGKNITTRNWNTIQKIAAMA